MGPSKKVSDLKRRIAGLNRLIEIRESDGDRPEGSVTINELQNKLITLRKELNEKLSSKKKED